MTLSYPVMDIIPWPNGKGFKGASSWWEYVHSRSEKERLDLLMATALLSKEVGRLLLNGDRALLDAFQFSDQTIALLSEIEANTLIEFAQALVNKIDYAAYSGSIQL